jgi:hypothetical protein
MTGSLYGFVKRRLTNHKEKRQKQKTKNKDYMTRGFLIKKKRQKRQKTKTKPFFFREFFFSFFRISSWCLFVPDYE